MGKMTAIPLIILQFIIFNYFGQADPGPSRKLNGDYNKNRLDNSKITRSTEDLLLELNSMVEILTSLEEEQVEINYAEAEEMCHADKISILESKIAANHAINDLCTAYIKHLPLIISRIRNESQNDNLRNMSTLGREAFEQTFDEVKAVPEAITKWQRAAKMHLNQYNCELERLRNHNSSFPISLLNTIESNVNLVQKNTESLLMILYSRYDAESLKAQNKVKMFVDTALHMPKNVLQKDNYTEALDAALKNFNGTSTKMSETCYKKLNERYVLLEQLTIDRQFSILHKGQHKLNDIFYRRLLNLTNKQETKFTNLKESVHQLTELCTMMKSKWHSLNIFGFMLSSLEYDVGVNMTGYMLPLVEALQNKFLPEVEHLESKLLSYEEKANSLKAELEVKKKWNDKFSIMADNRTFNVSESHLAHLINNGKEIMQCIQSLAEIGL